MTPPRRARSAWGIACSSARGRPRSTRTASSSRRTWASRVEIALVRDGDRRVRRRRWSGVAAGAVAAVAVVDVAPGLQGGTSTVSDPAGGHACAGRPRVGDDAQERRRRLRPSAHLGGSSGIGNPLLIGMFGRLVDRAVVSTGPLPPG